MEGLKLAAAKLVVYLHPSKAKNVADAIHGEISSLLFKFNETFDGVLLAYDTDFPSNLAKILPGVHPYFGVRLETKLLLFHPKPDMVLEGEVVRLSEQSIHVVILGFSAAAIMAEDIREEFKFKAKPGKEVFRSTIHKKHRIKIGTIIRFVVKSFDEEILHVSGSLLPAHTGCVKWLERHLEEWSQSDSTIKKRRANEQNREISEPDKAANDGETFAVNTESPNKKSKRRKKENS
ncbi:unnamed protein product [Coffea canephora]|uniref:DNA-directed RNA polymerase subunit n=2 Tax=Coffea TaxID=13442 RepID=A0A068UGT0_COFCA|nr:uncharacterized protein LOC113710903 isoform X1 [Coffea arabica]XP_027089772.1 uncharacterized protein LOC113710903 isoform X1 [Coffea arabica]XP_027089773.1 uncharacterized protein LOC113710903 isoform X1 [Coffea arabica]CDP07419.1 unnamed protein product [Coffea canephora]